MNQHIGRHIITHQSEIRQCHQIEIIIIQIVQKYISFQTLKYFLNERVLLLDINLQQYQPVYSVYRVPIMYNVYYTFQPTCWL